MKITTIILFALFSFLTTAQDFNQNFETVKVWKSANSKAGSKKYVVLAKMPVKSDIEVLIVYGKSAKDRWVTRYFPLFQGLSQFSPVYSQKVSDSYYDVLINVKDYRQEKIALKFKRTNSKNFKSYSYEPTEDDEVIERALLQTKFFNNKIKGALAKRVGSLTAFRAALLLTTQLTFVPEYFSKKDFPFRSIEGSIENYFESTPRNKKIATSKIKSDLSDPISKVFLPEGENWVKDSISKAQDLRDQVFYSYSKEASAIKNKALKKAASKYVLYQITEAYSERCFNNTYLTVGYRWILKDGSSFSFYPALTGCDQ